MNRLKTYLIATFLITWTCWWALVLLTRTGTMAYGYGQPLFMVFYLLGGLGPTMAAFVAVLATPAQSPLREFNARLFRWRWPGGGTWLARCCWPLLRSSQTTQPESMHEAKGESVWYSGPGLPR